MDEKDLSHWKIKNKQHTIAVQGWILTVLFSILAFLPFFESTPLSGKWALSFISIFLTVTGTIIALIFGSRSRKMKKLMSGEKLIAHWQMDREMLLRFSEETSRTQKEKSKALLWIVSIFFIVFSIAFLFILEDNERIPFLGIMLSVYLIIFVSARFFPWLYRRKNLLGDALVLIGSKYIYINGYFHNWDFPMSGLSKLKETKTPFRGIHMVYFYTDRTGRNTFQLKIPVPKGIDTKQLILRLKSENN